MSLDWVYGNHPDDESRLAVKFTEGEFTDVFVSIDKVSINEDNGEATLTFTFDILGFPETFNKSDLEDNDELKECVFEVIKDNIMNGAKGN